MSLLFGVMSCDMTPTMYAGDNRTLFIPNYTFRCHVATNGIYIVVYNIITYILQHTYTLKYIFYLLSKKKHLNISINIDIDMKAKKQSVTYTRQMCICPACGVRHVKKKKVIKK